MGVFAVDINKAAGTQMCSHWFSYSQCYYQMKLNIKQCKICLVEKLKKKSNDLNISHNELTYEYSHLRENYVVLVKQYDDLKKEYEDLIGCFM